VGRCFQCGWPPAVAHAEAASGAGTAQDGSKAGVVLLLAATGRGMDLQQSRPHHVCGMTGWWEGRHATHTRLKTGGWEEGVTWGPGSSCCASCTHQAARCGSLTHVRMHRSSLVLQQQCRKTVAFFHCCWQQGKEYPSLAGHCAVHELVLGPSASCLWAACGSGCCACAQQACCAPSTVTVRGARTGLKSAHVCSAQARIGTPHLPPPAPSCALTCHQDTIPDGNGAKSRTQSMEGDTSTDQTLARRCTVG